MNKRTIAREWLLFLSMLPFGFPSCLFIRYHADFVDFWNNAFGFRDEMLGRESWAWLLWFLPYILVMLIRSIVWAIKACANSN